MKHPIGTLDLETIRDDDLALLARYGDKEAMSIMWVRLIPHCQRIGYKILKKYKHIESQDVVQTVLSDLPKLIGRFTPGKAAAKTYFCISIYRAFQDTLRKHDPLGIKYPQKRKDYPAFVSISNFYGSSRLGDRSHEAILDESILDNMRSRKLNFETELSHMSVRKPILEEP
jgi:hypothetical protein